MPLDLLIRFSVSGDLAYLSHLDSLRLWQRLFRRAGWPLRFTEGFNVRPRIRLLLPRPVGITSNDEYLRIGLDADEPRLEQWTESLQATLPEGISLHGVAMAGHKTEDRVIAAEYVARCPEGRAPDSQRIIDLLAAETCPMRRCMDSRGNEKIVNIRPFVQSLRLEDDEVRMRLAVTNAGSARPSEVLTALGVAGEDLTATRLHRTQIIRSADEAADDSAVKDDHDAIDRQGEAATDKEST